MLNEAYVGVPFKRYATSNTFPAHPSGYLISKPPTEMVATRIKPEVGSRLVDALMVISESQTPTVARPEPNGIPPPELMLMVVAAIAAEDRRPKNKRKSSTGLLYIRLITLTYLKLAPNPKFEHGICRFELLVILSPKLVTA